MSIERCRTRLSRTAKTSVATSAQSEPDPLHVGRAVALADEQEAADHDQERPHEQARVQRLVEEEERDRDREERRGTDDHRGARRPGVADREREEELRQPRSEEAGEHEGPDRGDIVRLAGDERERHRERGDHGQQRTSLRVRRPREREAEAHRHRAEERGRDESEHDRVHRAKLQPVRSAAVADPRIRELAELLVNRSLDVQPGWQVVDPDDAARPAAPHRGREGDRAPRGLRARADDVERALSRRPRLGARRAARAARDAAGDRGLLRRAGGRSPDDHRAGGSACGRRLRAGAAAADSALAGARRPSGAARSTSAGR